MKESIEELSNNLSDSYRHWSNDNPDVLVCTFYLPENENVICKCTYDKNTDDFSFSTSSSDYELSFTENELDLIKDYVRNALHERIKSTHHENLSDLYEDCTDMYWENSSTFVCRFGSWQDTDGAFEYVCKYDEEEDEYTFDRFYGDGFGSVSANFTKEQKQDIKDYMQNKINEMEVGIEP